MRYTNDYGGFTARMVDIGEKNEQVNGELSLEVKADG